MSWHCVEDNKTVTARKRHLCDLCGSQIDKAASHVTRSGVEPGEGFHRMHLHPECDRYSAKWDSEDWEIVGDVSLRDVHEWEQFSIILEDVSKLWTPKVKARHTK